MADIRDLLRPPHGPRRLRGPEEFPRTHWRVASDPVWQKRRRSKLPDSIQLLLLSVFGGAVLGAASIYVPWPFTGPSGGISLFKRAALWKAPSPAAGTSPATVSRQFGFCHTGGGTNCVVDGDTIWLDGMKIRLADIDTPETHPPRCPSEAALGARATDRLLTLLNSGPVTLASIYRDEDRYGRKLRIVLREGRSVGDQLIAEGLARPWTGSRLPWCNT